MFKRLAIACILAVFASAAVAQDATRFARSEQPAEQGHNQALTDAAIVALIIAGSIAAYKAMGRPCACPSDTMNNGRSCGGNSAWSRAGGAKPLCFPTDITTGMIAAYRATKAIPTLH